MRSSKSRVSGLPDALESPRAKLVYLSLAREGPATVSELVDRLNESHLALFSVLDTLAERGLVTESGERYAPAGDG